MYALATSDQPSAEDLLGLFFSGFSSNVTGDLSLGFSHFRETSGIIRRSIRVEMRGQFRF